MFLPVLLTAKRSALLPVVELRTAQALCAPETLILFPLQQNFLGRQFLNVS
jgi:hypothetical protein